MKITAVHNFAEVLRRLDRVAKTQLPFATMLALNATAWQVKLATEREMPRYLDRPTPWTLRSVRYTKARKDRLQAEIWFDPWGNKRAVTAEKFLGPQIFGGTRSAKGFERKLRQAGILPEGMFVVPGAGAPLDRYGNVPGSFLVKILSQLGAAEGVAGFLANQTPTSKRRRIARNRRRVDYFVGGQGRAAHLPPGIYSRTYFGFGTAIRPVLMFVGRATYRQRFPFFEIGRAVAAREFPREFDAALSRALATAR